jgi:hypothetical protein
MATRKIRTDSGTHECPKIGCNRRVSQNKLACFEHWNLVSKPTQDLVYATYHTGAMSPEHFQAMADAIAEMNPELAEEENEYQAAADALAETDSEE